MSKIALPIAELRPALIGLGKVVAKRATLPVLSHIKIERTKDGWIALTGTNLDAFITVRLEQPSEVEPLSLLVLYDELLKITKNCQKADTILIRRDGVASDPSVVIEYAVGSQIAETKVGSLPIEEFPEIPRMKGEPVAVNDMLRQSIHEAMDCASTDESRLILNSACIDVSNPDGHYVVGTNGSHLYSSNSFKLPMKECFILPTHRFLGFKDFNNDGEWQLRFTTPGHKGDTPWFQLSSRRWRFIGRQIEGNYPNWRQVVPSESQFTTSIQFNELDKLADTIERLPDHDQKDHAIGIERIGNTVHLLWKSERTEPWKRLEVNHDRLKGAETKIYVNRHYLIKALRFGLGRLQLSDPMSPMRFSHDGRQLIVMPVRGDSAPPTPTAASQVQERNPQQPAAPPSAAQPERSPMVTDTTGNTTTEPATIDAQLDQLIEEVESMKITTQDHLTGLKSLGTKLKSIQREHKTSTKELQTVRQTLKGLQGLKL